ncbi:MAG: glycerol-3-phosphate dehydrogenase/oxidase [Pirellulales bacterium]
METEPKRVLILGAGINGCAVARELALNGLSVWLVDSADVASGATSGSSRLIHGGLRYLEYGEFDLVKESLEERTRLLRLAPQFVHSLRLWIPATSRFGGAVGAVGRFFGWSWWPQPKVNRGSALIGAGLTMYDFYARDATVPKHTCGSTPVAGAPPVDRRKYRRLCSYYDGQVMFPERLLLSMLEDARRVSQERGLDFRVFTYHQARLNGKTVEISPSDKARSDQACTLEPAVIVNATGAWVDETLKRLHVPSQRLMGGTKGSHFFTFNQRLREQLAAQGIYAEASDGRPVFITPLEQAVLIGTTDIPFQGPPEDARATEGELAYLLDAVNTVLPEARLTESDIDFHYSAVRPLPYTDANSTAAITRRHSFVWQTGTAVPMFSVVGGKLTTMRSLAEQAAGVTLEHLGRTPTANSRERVFPGGDDYPQGAVAVAATQQAIAQGSGRSAAAVAAVWKLCGTRSAEILEASADRTLVNDLDLPCSFVRWSIEHEHAHTLADLVERRLMLLYHQRLTRGCLRRLAELLAEAGRLPSGDVDAAVEAEINRLRARYGKRVA